MADPDSSATIDPAILDAINQSQAATMAQQVLIGGGAGRAYQSVAVSAAIAIQDATDTLRNLSSISATALGVAMAQMIDDPATGQKIYDAAQKALALAADHYAAVCTAAAKSLKEFPTN